MELADQLAKRALPMMSYKRHENVIETPKNA